MIAFLNGKLFQAMPDAITVEVAGLGYEVQIHNRMLSQLPPVGGQILVHTYLQVMENEFKLYGFFNRGELDLFKLLLTVSGIGARAALNILGTLEPERFFQAVASGDEKSLTTVPGIGKKTAQRLIFELKDKIGSYQGAILASPEDNSILEDIMEALETLGYSRSEIFPLLMELQSQGELADRVEDNIKKVLKQKARVHGKL